MRALALLLALTLTSPAGAQEAGPTAAQAHARALALHEEGEDLACLDALSDWDAGRRRGGRIEAVEPKLRAAMRALNGACAKACLDEPGHPACLWAAAERQIDRMLPGFAAAPCPLPVEGPSVDLGSGRCLALTPSPETFDVPTAVEVDPARICPGLSLVGPEGTQKIEPPHRSILRTPQFCCVDLRLNRAPNGDIEAVPAENPPEDCLSGHRYTVLQDVLRLRNGRLRLVRRLHRD